MSRKILYNDMNELIEMIREQSSIICNYTGKIPQIEIDIVMSNIRRLYDDYVELARVNRHFVAEIPVDQVNEKKEAIQDTELVKIIDKIPPPEKKEEVPDIETPPKKEETAQEEKIPVEKEESKKKDNSQTIDLFGETDKMTLADKFKNQNKSTHDKYIDNQNDKTIGEIIRQPISDLKSGIGVNDRFLLINELFRGVMADYDLAITELDLCANYRDALARLNAYQAELQWNTSGEAFKRFENFIYRKFAGK